MSGRIAIVALLCAAACGPAVGTVPAGGSEGGGSEDGEPEDPMPEPGACDDPTALVQPGPAGAPSGFEACADGFIHRVQPVQCDPGGFVDGDCENPWNSDGECMSDDECVDEAGTRGVCLDSGVPWSGCSCSYGCSSDADCEADEACLCDGARSECIPASCRTAADCNAGQLCGLEEKVSVCGTISRALSCTTNGDACRVDAECDDECFQCLPTFQSAQRTCTPETGICTPCG